MPIEDQMRFGNLPAPLNYKLDQICEECLTQRNMSRVNVCFLECGEKELAWSSIIRIRAHHHYWDSKSLKHLQSSFSPMVSCAVPLDQCALPPVWIQPVELHY
jgi:hypothetical protein